MGERKVEGRSRVSRVKTYAPVVEGPGAALDRRLALTVEMDYFGRSDHGAQIRDKVEQLIRLHYGSTACVRLVAYDNHENHKGEGNGKHSAEIV